MRVFSLIISFLVALSLLLFPAPLKVQAAETQPYAYVLPNSTVYFCTEREDDTAIFAIPQTYCITILSDLGNWYYCRYAEDVGIYQALYGYCRKVGLQEISQPLSNLFLNLPVSVTFTSNVTDGGLPTLGEIEVTAAYYGSYTMAATSYSYVRYNSQFGYIKTEISSYPLNTLPTEEEVAPTETKNYTAVAALVILAVAALAVAVLYFSSSKKYKH